MKYYELVDEWGGDCHWQNLVECDQESAEFISYVDHQCELSQLRELLIAGDRRNETMRELLRLVSSDEEFFPIRKRYWDRISVALKIATDQRGE